MARSAVIEAQRNHFVIAPHPAVSGKAPMRISARAQRIEPFYVMEMAKSAAVIAREAAGTDRPMIYLNIGEPDFTAPPLVRQAAEKDISEQYGVPVELALWVKVDKDWTTNPLTLRQMGYLGDY